MSLGSNWKVLSDSQVILNYKLYVHIQILP